MPKIFISYRRADSAETVNRLYDRFVYAFGRDSVFKDVDTLQRGDDFPDVLRHWVQTCDVFLSVIGQRWLTIQDEAGRRRLDNPNDWVRQETEMALARGKDCLLIPTIVYKAILPKTEHLPETLASLANKNTQTINPQRFHEDVGELIAFLRHHFGLVPPPPAVDHDKAFRDLVAMIKINDIEAARDILAAMHGQGNIPARIRLDAVEQGLYRKVQLRERDLAYNSIQPLADLADDGILPSSEVTAAMDAFRQTYPEFANYDPNNFARFNHDASRIGIAMIGPSDSISLTESASVIKIPDLSAYNDAVLKVLPPPFEWCFVPGGKVTLETDPPKTYTIPDFAIAKYTITNAQYQVFVEAPDGYKDTEWYNFSDAVRNYRSEKPKPTTPAYDGGTLPRNNISWYDSVAFTRWLSSSTGLSISLPTEQQWQRAAVGDTGWIYPWGNEFDSLRCNTSESGVRKPVPVIEYPTGASPYGVLNMSGNLWEWCLTNYTNPDNSDIRNIVSRRVLRGGSFNYFQSGATASYREFSSSYDADQLFGFRCVLSAPTT